MYVESDACWPACSQPVPCPRLGGSKAWSAHLLQRPAAEVLQRSRGVAASQGLPLRCLPPVLKGAAKIAPLETCSHPTGEVPAGGTRRGWQPVGRGAEQECSMLGLQALSCCRAPEEALRAWPLPRWRPLCRSGTSLASALSAVPSTLHIGCMVNLLTPAASVVMGALFVPHRRLWAQSCQTRSFLRSLPSSERPCSMLSPTRRLCSRTVISHLQDGTETLLMATNSRFRC